MMLSGWEKEGAAVNSDGLRALARRWLWLVVLIVAGAGAASYGISAQLPRVYESTSRLLVVPGQVGAGAQSYDDTLSAERLARTYTELLKSRRVIEASVAALGLGLSYEAAVPMIDARPVVNTQLIQVSVRANGPEAAARFTDQLTSTFIQRLAAIQTDRFAANEEFVQQQVDQLSAELTNRTRDVDELRGQPANPQRDSDLARAQVALSRVQQSYQTATQRAEDLRLAKIRSDPSVVVIDAADLPATAISPRVAQNVLLGAIAGLLVAVGIAFTLEHFDDRVHSPERVAQVTGLHTLTSIGVHRNGRDGSELAEAFRTLRTNLMFGAVSRSLRTLLITSAETGDGRTSTAASLAIAIAQAGSRVLLVDADFRRPSLHEVFGVSNQSGLSSLIADDDLIAGHAVVPTGINGVQLLASGPLPADPSDLLASQRMRRRLQELTEVADLVIVDSPPVWPVSDASVLASWVDGTLIVLNARRARAQRVKEAVTCLNDTGAQLLGVVLNQVRRRHTALARHYLDAGTPETWASAS
jgi:capsular exopolysaccharide synthesis family protein